MSGKSHASYIRESRTLSRRSSFLGTGSCVFVLNPLQLLIYFRFKETLFLQDYHRRSVILLSNRSCLITIDDNSLLYRISYKNMRQNDSKLVYSLNIRMSSVLTMNSPACETRWYSSAKDFPGHPVYLTIICMYNALGRRSRLPGRSR